tara:strand:+ start:591 stop:863 length:273 start_codon:yes stop_codon:yes gene_type:complete
MYAVMTTTDPQVQNAFIDAKDPNLIIEIMLLGLKNRIDILSFNALLLCISQNSKQKAAIPFPITMESDDPAIPMLCIGPMPNMNIAPNII